MKLVDLVKSVNNYDDELSIFVEDLENYDSSGAEVHFSTQNILGTLFRICSPIPCPLV